MHRKGGYPRPYYQGGPKPFQQPHNPYYPEAGYPVTPYALPKRPDVVGYTGGGGGAGRVSLTAQYTSVAASHPPPNSAVQVQQQASQNQQIRAQAPPLPPTHNPHNTAGAPPPSVSHSQHLSHPHSALAQHQHHSVLSSGNVSGGAGLQNPVPQSAVSVQPGQSPAPPGSQHELNAQGIPQVTTQQLQGQGVTLSGNVTASHSIMYPNGNPNQIPQNQQQNPQVRNLIGSHQYFHSQQQAATPHMHPGNPQHRQVMTHAMTNIPGGYPFANLAQPLIQSNQLYSQFTAATLAAQQHRPGTTSNHQFAPQMTQPQPNHYHIPYAVQATGFQPYVEGNGKAAWGSVKGHQFPPTVFYQQHKAVATPAPPAQREKKIMAIIDPNTNKNILEEMSLAKANSSPSPMQSTESSTANTPALSEADAAQTKGALIAQEFALQVLLSGDEGVTNEQSESIECGLSTDKSIESSHCVINSEVNEISVDSQNIINQDIVPEPIVISKCEQPVVIQSQPPSLPPQLPQSDIQIGIPSMPTNITPQAQAPTQQPPPQPQRQAKQPRGSQQHQNVHAKNANQQQNSNKQPPPQHGNKNQAKSINQKGNQAVQGQQQQSAKGRSSPNAQQNQKIPQNTQQPQQQQNKQMLPQAQQSKLPSENTHQASKVHQSNQASSHQQSHVQTLKEVVPQHQEPVVPIHNTQPQKGLSHGQGYRGPSPPQQATGAAQGMAGRRMSGEQAPPASAGPIKPDKRPSPPVEHVVEALKEPANKHSSAKSASVSPVTTAAPTKKEISPEPQVGQGKRAGKDKVPDDASPQPKDVKEHPKTQVDEAPPKVAAAEAPPAPQSNKQPSQGKPPKSQQPTNNEKVVEATMQSTSQSPKFDSLSQQSSANTPVPQISDAPLRVPQAEVPEAVASNGVDSITTSSSSSGSSSSQMEKPEPVEVQLNHVDEVPVNNHEENHVAEKPKSSSLKKYNYKEGQWSPENQDGKRQYDRDFLLEMQRNPLSLKRPDSLPNLEVVLDGPVNRPMDGKHKIVSDFTPAFLQNSNRRNQKFVGRNSQQGQKKGSDRGGDKDKSGEQKIVTISFDSRLQKSNNAWKPSTKKSETADDDATVRKMRGILNKLTPDNFRKLVDQVRNFNIRKFETFQQVIELIFEKAVDEQSFSTTYAELCKVLSQMSVRVEEREDETRFRNLIINKCQTEFEKDNSTFLKREEKEKEIEAETDREKKIELKATLDFEETRLRKRSVGNVRFIGELYKLKMLTSSIMMRIIGTLLNSKDEESLECLCKLLTTIGKLLESNAQQSVKAQVISANVNQNQSKQTPQDDLNEIFNRMKKLVESRKTSSRVRFLLMDVIDLRLNNWVPRREDAKPKTKAQVHEDIRKEEMEQQYLLSTAPRKDDRDRERKRSRDTRGGMQQPDEGWSIASNPRRGPFDSSRLRNNTFINRASGDNNVEFRAGFNCWARGSSGGMKDQEEEQQRPFNRFAVLDNQFPQEMRRSNPVSGTFTPSFRPPRLAPGGGNAPHRQGTGSFGSKSMPHPSEKEHGNASHKMLSGSGDRSKSNSRSNSRQSSRESSLVRDHPVGAPSHREVPQTVQKLDDASVSKFTKGIVEEYISSNDVKEAVLCVQEKFKGKNVVLFIQFSLEWVVDKNDDKRKKVGNLYHCLLKNKLITLNDLVEGTKDVIEMIPDFEIDIPQVSEYVGVILSRLVVDNVVTLQDIVKLIEPAGSRYPTIFATVLKESSSVLGETRVRDMFKSSELDLDKLVPAGTTVQDYLAKHDISFVLNESIMYNNRPISDEEAPIDAKFVRGELTRLFKKHADEEEIFKWIEANVGRFTNTKKFVRALTAALLVSLLASSDGNPYVTVPDFEEKLKERAKFIYKYVDNNQHFELACLYSIQGLSVEYQHPSGFVEKAFNSLYDRDTISDETFFKWEKSDDPEEQVGKGVCVTSVNKFLKWLKEAEQEPDHAELGVEGN